MRFAIAGDFSGGYKAKNVGLKPWDLELWAWRVYGLRCRLRSLMALKEKGMRRYLYIYIYTCNHKPFQERIVRGHLGFANCSWSKRLKTPGHKTKELRV